MNLKEFRAQTLAALAVATGNRDEARAMERIILEDVMLMRPAQALAEPEREVPDFIEAKVRRIINRVLGGEPLQYALGTARFYGMELKVTPDVLIPRPETEQLVDLIVERFRTRTDMKVLDLGTGSGCIAIALARTLKFPQVTALDISEAALRVARANAARHNVKIDFRKGDIRKLDALGGCWDIIVSNPPYVLESEAREMERHVLDYEPRLALFVPDSDPLRFYNPIIDYWQTHHEQGGLLALEINPLSVAEFRGASIIKDFYGKDRFAVYE